MALQGRKWLRGVSIFTQVSFAEADLSAEGLSNG